MYYLDVYFDAIFQTDQDNSDWYGIRLENEVKNVRDINQVIKFYRLITKVLNQFGYNIQPSQFIDYLDNNNFVEKVRFEVFGFTELIDTSFANLEVAKVYYKNSSNSEIYYKMIFGDYFDESRKEMTWGTSKIPCYQRTYETVIRVILENKFEIIGYKDAKTTKAAKKNSPRDYKIYSKLPWFCVWKLRKK